MVLAVPLYNVLLLIFYKDTIRDPEGEALSRELQVLGFELVRRVRAGKALVVSIDAASSDEAVRMASDLAGKLRLYNPIVQTVKVMLID